MTREDTIKILSLVRANYPLVKISDPAAMVSAWHMNLADYDTEKVLKAVKFHMKTSKYFPTPADLIEVMTRADLVYNEPPRDVPSIEAPRAKVTAIPDGMSEEEFLDNLCQQMVELEEECWPDEPRKVESNILGGCLPYEE